MYIVVAGIKRSGSTWQANLIRIIMEELGFNVWMGEELEGKEKEGYVVTISKIHPPHPQPFKKAEKVFTSFRNIRDIAESWSRFQGSPPDVGLLNNWLIWLQRWMLHPNHAHHMWYDGLPDPQGGWHIDEVGEVQKHLDVLDPHADIRIQTVLGRLREEVVPPAEGYDPKTCLFSNHITKP